jgi:O-antigen ligase
VTQSVPVSYARGPASAATPSAALGGLASVAGWCFVLFAAALPVAIAPMNLAGGLCAALTVVVWLSRPGPRWVRSPVDLPALAWLVAMAVATLLSIDRAASAASLGKGLIPWVTGLAAWHAADRRRGAAAIAALLVAGSVAALIGVSRFLSAGGRFPARAIGFSGSWMTFGLQMLLLVSLAAGIGITARGCGWRVGSLVAALAGTLGLAASFTRSAWLGLAAAVALILGLRRPRALVLLALAAVVAYAVLPGDLGDRLRSAFDPTHPANRERTMMWEAGASAFRAHPLTGVGLLDLRPVLDPYRSPLALERPTHLHDSYLQVAVTTGILGLIAFLALCVALVRSACVGPPGLRRATGLAAGVRLGVTAGAVGFLIAALFDHAFGDEPLLFLLFTLAGIAWAARGWHDAVDAAPSPGAAGVRTLAGPRGGAHPA